MTIINQDRDIAITFNPQFDELVVIPVAHQGKLLAYNIWCKDVMLGTFDNLQEAQAEIDRILKYPYEIYVMSGYSCWEEWETLKEVMTNE